MKEEIAASSWPCATARETGGGAGAGGSADPTPPPFLETKNQLRLLPEMPRIFSFRLQCGGEGARCGRGPGSHCQPAKVTSGVN